MAQFRIYRSTDENAPVLSGQIGALIPILDACLVDGFTPQSVTGITRIGDVATVEKSGHKYMNGDLVTIAGADQAAYNGEFVVKNRTANTFEIDVLGSPATPATGTLTMTKAGAGWTKAFTDTNKAAYLQGGGPLQYLRINDAAAQYVDVRGYESMSDVDTGTGLFPTSSVATFVWFKSSSADATARDWAVYATDSMLYLWVSGGSNLTALFVFGEFKSYKSDDVYNNILYGANATSSSSTYWGAMAALDQNMSSSSSYKYVARTYTQIGSAIPVGTHSDYAKLRAASQSGAPGGGFQYPNGSDNGLYVAPVWVHEATSPYVLRGEMPGMWCLLHDAANFAHGDRFSGTGTMAGKTFEIVDVYNQSSQRCAWAIEVSDTLSL